MKRILCFLLLVCGTSSVHAFFPASAKGTSKVQRQQGPPNVTDHVAIQLSLEPEDQSESLVPEISALDFSALKDKLLKLDFGQVLSNLQSGEVGTRGEFYVIGQFALIFCIVLGGVPSIFEPLLLVTGPIFLLGGLAVVGLALLDLGTDSLTPFLPPTEQGSFKSEGIYSQVRHPLYAGLVVSMAGFSIITNSAIRLMLTVALFVLVRTKATIEEDYLTQKYPEYKDYMEKVPGKLFPSDLLDGLK